MKRWLFKVGLLGLAVAVLGALVVVSGLIPIGASSGHWPITEWFLHLSLIHI